MRDHSNRLARLNLTLEEDLVMWLYMVSKLFFHFVSCLPQSASFSDGCLFTILELTSKVVQHRFPPLPALPTFIKSTHTMSNPPAAPTTQLASEILISPLNVFFPTPYLYLSKRNDLSPPGDIYLFY